MKENNELNTTQSKKPDLEAILIHLLDTYEFYTSVAYRLNIEKYELDAFIKPRC